MIVFERVDVGASGSGAREDEFRGGRIGGWIDFGLFHSPSILLRSPHDRPPPSAHLPDEDRSSTPQSGLVQQDVGDNAI